MQTTLPSSLLFETGTVRRLAERLQGEEIRCQTRRRERPFVPFLHGDFTHGGVSVKRLAAMLGPDRPTLAIAPHGMDGEQVPASKRVISPP